MSSQTTRTLGCSGCLIEAIERHDKTRLHNLLSAANVEYSDTHWVARANLCKTFKNFLILSSAPYSLTSESQCSHPLVEETPTPGLPANVAMSVVLYSMLHTTAEFNAFQLLVESRKFDVKEPLMFHIRRCKIEWRFFIVDTAGMALFLDKGIDMNDANSFLLVKTLVRICSLNPELNLQSIEVNSSYNYEWKVCRGRDALSFIYVIWKFCSPIVDLYLVSGSLSLADWLLARLKAISSVGLCLNPSLGSISNCNLSFRGLRVDRDFSMKAFSVLAALFKLFCLETNPYIEYFVGQLIRCGLIGVSSDSSEDGYDVLSQLIDLLLFHDFEAPRFFESPREFRRRIARLSSPTKSVFRNARFGSPREPVFRIVRESLWESVFRITRQLLALCFFRGRGALYFHCYLQCNPVDENRVFSICSLQTEFFRNPLSLQQQSRGAIRQLVGMNDFEGRVQNLPLPPLLLEYVWGANEMLADMKDFEDLEDIL